jgi:hypothetical protein
VSHTLSQVKSFPPGTVIPKVEGTIKVIWPREAKQSAKGPYTIQNGVLQAEGEEIDFTLWSHDDVAFLKGKHASFASVGKDGRTKKIKGVETKEHYKKPGVMTLQVYGEGGGVVTGDQPNPAYMRGTPENAAAGTQPAPAAPATNYGAPPVQRPEPFTPPSLGEGPQDKLTRLAVFWLACWHKTGSVEGLSDSVRQSFAASLFIEGNKQGLAAAWPIERAPAHTTPPPSHHAAPPQNDDVLF